MYWMVSALIAMVFSVLQLNAAPITFTYSTFFSPTSQPFVLDFTFESTASPSFSSPNMAAYPLVSFLADLAETTASSASVVLW